MKTTHSHSPLPAWSRLWPGGHRRAICDTRAVPLAPPRRASGGAGPADAAAGTAALTKRDVEKYLKLAEADPTSVAPRVALANLYFDAERYSDAREVV